ncbi:MAG: hypothetical protein NXI30_20825 [bacterium]|nr:hypothetical protein [bacterium]
MSEDSISVPYVVPIWLVGFAGHRPSNSKGRSGQELEQCSAAIRTKLRELAQQAERACGTIELVSGAASGADLVAIAAADDLEIPVHLLLPLDEESFFQDFADSPDDLSKAKRYIERAHDPGSGWTIRVADGDQKRPDCYHDASLQLLEIVNVLVAVLRPGEADGDRMGGTAETVRLANADHMDLPTILIDPENGGSVYKDVDLPVSTAGATYRLLRDINGDLSSSAAHSGGYDGQRGLGAEESVWQIFRSLDNVANASGQTYRGSLRASVLLHFFATACAAIVASFSALFIDALVVVPKLLTTLELLLVLAALLLLGRTHRLGTNPTWRRSRFAAELADGLICSAALTDPLRPRIARHDNTWNLFAVSLALRANREQRQRLADLDHVRRIGRLFEEYGRKRLEYQRDQYFGEQQKYSLVSFQRWSLVSRLTSVGAIGVIALALMLKVGAPTFSATPVGSFAVLFLPILLPLVAGLASTMIISLDAGRRSARYEEVLQRLDHFLSIRDGLRTESSMRLFVERAEHVLEDELVEWHATASSVNH